MPTEKTVPLGGDREAVLKAALDCRPALEVPVAEVRLKAPWWPGRVRSRMIAFLDSLVAAYRIRAGDEKDLTVVEEGDRVVVRRALPGGSSEVRFERIGKGNAVLNCDRRELDNLYQLGILARARVSWPKGGFSSE